MRLLRRWRWPYLVLFIAAFLIAVVGVTGFIFPPPEGRPSIVGGVALGAILYGLMAFAWRRGLTDKRPRGDGAPPDLPGRPA